jgi:hypothetical protein
MPGHSLATGPECGSGRPLGSTATAPPHTKQCPRVGTSESGHPRPVPKTRLWCVMSLTRWSKTRCRSASRLRTVPLLHLIVEHSVAPGAADGPRVTDEVEQSRIKHYHTFLTHRCISLRSVGYCSAGQVKERWPDHAVVASRMIAARLRPRGRRTTPSNHYATLSYACPCRAASITASWRLTSASAASTPWSVGYTR